MQEPKKDSVDCDSKRNSTRVLMKLMISAGIKLMTFRQQINPDQNSVQLVMWPQLQHEIVKDDQLTKKSQSQ